MFIGSSTEGLEIARALQAELEHDIDSKIWSQGVFGLSRTGIESLEAEARMVDFAALVLTPDDLVTKRGASETAPRDNLSFEAGLFIAALGRDRVFLVSCRDDALDLPSDLDGITPAQFNKRSDLRAAIGPAATTIRSAVNAATSLGPTSSVARAAFEQPENRSSVPRNPTITGRAAGIPAGKELWAVVGPPTQAKRYHPQADALAVTNDGRFEGTVYVGLSDSAGIFPLLLVLVDSTDGQRLRQYTGNAARTQTYEGLLILPASAKILDEIWVTRI